MRYQQIEKLASEFQLAVVLAQVPAASAERPWVISKHAAELTLIGRRLIRNGVNRCNYGDTPRNSAEFNRLEKRANEIAALYGLTADASGDPRGYVLRLHGEGLPRNNMGDGFGVA